MVCFVFHSLIDRIDTSLFTGCIDRYHWLRHTGYFITKTIIDALMILTSASALWTLPTQTRYFCGILNMPVTSLTTFFIHLLRNPFHPHLNYGNTRRPVPTVLLYSYPRLASGNDIS